MSDNVVEFRQRRTVVVVDGGKVTQSTDATEVGQMMFYAEVIEGPLQGFVWEFDNLEQVRKAALDVIGNNGHIIDRCADGS